MKTICPYCNGDGSCGIDCIEAKKVRASRIDLFKIKLARTNYRLQRMQQGELEAFEEELIELENDPLRTQPRIVGDAFYQRINLVIILAEQFKFRDLATKLRKMPEYVSSVVQ